MPRLPRTTGADAVHALSGAGWHEARRKGSHVILRHPDKPARRVVVPVHAGRILKPGTLLSILTHAELTVDEFIQLL